MWKVKLNRPQFRAQALHYQAGGESSSVAVGCLGGRVRRSVGEGEGGDYKVI